MKRKVKREQKHRERVDGLLVRDAKRPIELTLRQRDIAYARPLDPCACGFAKAAMRQFGAKKARFNQTRIFIERGGVYLRYRTSKGIADQIGLFDKNGDMGTGTYPIDIVAPSHELGVQRTGTRRGSKGTRPYHKTTRRTQRPVYKSDE